jgi:outer membrane protein TolC
LSASGSHRFSTTPGGFDAQGRAFSATRSESDTVSAGIGGPGVGATGLLPSGLTYSLSGSASDTVLQPVTPFSEKSQSSATLTLRQPLLKNFWIDATRTNIKIGKNRLKYSELAFQFQVMTMVNNVAKAYYELIFSAENIKVQQAALDLAERLVAENKKRVQVGTLAPLDEKQAESQAASSRADLLKAQNDAATQENVLKGLMTDNYTELHAARLTPTEVLAAPVPVLSLNASWAMGLTQRPDLLQSRLDVEKQNIQIRYSYNQLFPQLDLIGSYGYAGSGKEFSDALAPIGTGSNPSYSFGAAVNFPLGNHAARAIYKSSKEQKKAFLLALKSLEQSILVQIDNAVKQVQNAFERVDATRQARAYAETALDAEQKKLESGKSTSFQVLQLQKNLTDARLAEIRALADFNKAQSDLHFQEGSILDKNHLKVDVK